MKSLKWRELREILLAYDRRFSFYSKKGSGKGSHRAIEHPDIDGRRIAFTVPIHGEGDEIKTPYKSKIRRDFKLPKDIFD